MAMVEIKDWLPKTAAHLGHLAQLTCPEKKATIRLICSTMETKSERLVGPISVDDPAVRIRLRQ